MSSPLSGIGLQKRRQVAATLAVMALLFLAVGAVATTSATSATVKAFVAIALLVGVLLGLMAWGVVRSIKLDVHERRLDAAIEAAVRASGRSLCDCGVEHDPDELHFVDGPGQHLTGARRADAGGAECAHDGSGADCSHTCDTCMLTAMRPSPQASPEQRHYGA